MMIFRGIESAVNEVRNYVSIGARLLVGTMMVFAVGLPLLVGLRLEALIPLGLGGYALYGAAKDLGWITK